MTRRHDLRLFDDFVRTDANRAHPADEGFAWWNRSARPEVEAMRSELEHWFGRYCPADAARLRREFRMKRRPQHLGALFELFIHEQLLLAGFEVECQVDLPGVPTKPDFLVRLAGRDVFYIEAKTKLDTSEAAAQEKRLRAVLEHVRSLPSHGFFVTASGQGHLSRSVETGSLRRALEEWLLALDYEQEAELARTFQPSSRLTCKWQADGLRLTFRATPMPKGEGPLPKTSLGFILPSGCQIVTTDSEIAGAVAEKARRYGELGLPYLIAVNLMDISVERGDVESGFEMAFGFEGSSRHRRVSGVLLAHVPNMAGAVAHIPHLVLNPMAEHPLGEHVAAFTPFTSHLRTRATAPTP